MIINKIKYKYYDNLIQKYIEAGDVSEINNIFSKILNYPNSTYLNLLQKYLYKVCDIEKFKNTCSKNLIWINSFDLDDCQIINNFVSYIYKENSLDLVGPKNYHDYLSDIMINKKINNISFQDLVDYSYLYQFMIGSSSDSDVLINTSSAFFESNLKRYFTHPCFTKYFIYVIKDPSQLYLKQKKINPDNPMHGFLSSNTDFMKRHQIQSNAFIEENIQNWATNVSSWTNSNVMSTFRGYIVKYESLLENPKQILAELIGHMIQAGVKLKLDYGAIDKFLNDISPLDERGTDETLSNKENKLIKRDLFTVASKFGYLNK